MNKVYSFLRDLQANNSKEWMDNNRKYYEEARDIWVEQLSVVYQRLAKHDPHFEHINPRKTLMRINTNRMFHPDKPIYKDSFASSPYKVEVSAIYLHISPNGNMIGGGLYRPDSKTLKKIREAIDYDGHELKQIISKKSFVDYFGGLAKDEEMLKTSPRGYSEDHQHIDLLRRKSFAAIKAPTEKEVTSSKYVDIIERGFLELVSLNQYLNKAISF